MDSSQLQLPRQAAHLRLLLLLQKKNGKKIRGGDRMTGEPGAGIDGQDIGVVTGVQLREPVTGAR